MYNETTKKELSALRMIVENFPNGTISLIDKNLIFNLH